MLARLFVIAMILAFALPAVAARADDSMVDRPLGKTFAYAGVNFRIDSIETAKSKLDIPALKDMSENNDAPGFVIVHATMQNPAKDDRSVPGSSFGWELQDGSQRDMGGPDQAYAGRSLVEAPGTLHPKQTVQLTYVIGGWNGSPITKLFVKKNSGDDNSSTGAQYVRFQIRPADTKALDG